MKDADLVITGEGSLDRRRSKGKNAGGSGAAGTKAGSHFAMLHASEDGKLAKFCRYLQKRAKGGMSQQENMKRAAELLRANARELAETFGIGCRRRCWKRP